MSGILAGEDEKSRALRVLILLLAVLLCVFFLLSACASHRLLTVSEPAPRSLFRDSEGTDAAQDAFEAFAGLRLAAPALPGCHIAYPDSKGAPRTFFRLFLRLDESSGVIAANIGGHAPPASWFFTGGSMGPSRL